MKVLLRLYLSFFKIGLLTFGGGLSMLPMLEREVIVRRAWVTKQDVLDYYAVGQCTPGVIAVDVAAFVGYKVKKAVGTVTAALAVVTPGLCAVLLLATVFQLAAKYEIVQSAFAGIRVATCALLTASVVKILRESVRNWWQIAIAVVSFALVAVLGANPMWVVLGAGLFGVVRMKIRV
ncbi:MAG: chromate transporter [Oscillospiraceae bacterium]|jgi:chromate transporter|nr:chromate transporter [Oscillospiraceae bacterium]